MPVYDFGTLADGRLFFTMKEVRGETLSVVIQAVHDALASDHPRDDHGWPELRNGWSLRRMVSALQRACEAVGYAHTQGVLHRDLKPANLMIGEFGEVMVLDWGLTSLTEGDGGTQSLAVTTDSGGGSAGSRLNAGTPPFMAPEQINALAADLTPATDIYALGAVLYCILVGELPTGVKRVDGRLRWFASAPIPESPGTAGSAARVPDELRRICNRAMAEVPAERFESATALADALGDWLDGVARRSEAMVQVERARAALARADALRAKVGELRGQARQILGQMPPFAPVQYKQPAWALQDEAEKLFEQAELADIEMQQLARTALTLSPNLADAHQLLADAYQARHAEAEKARDRSAARRFEAALRLHDRGRHSGWLEGTGRLTLHTEVPCSATLYRYVSQGRVLVPELVEELGHTPVCGIQLAMGSYLVELRAEGRETVRYPVAIGRNTHWTCTRLASSGPEAIELPTLGSLATDERFVAGGWCTTGGDANAKNSLPERTVWLPSFIAKRDPVTVREYLVFLNALLDSGQAELAEKVAPPLPAWEERGALSKDQHDFHIGLSPTGAYVLLGDDRNADLPVTMVNWASAQAYTHWYAGHTGHTGQPWRLITELEHEKAARGTDARAFPWGEYLDPTFCRMRLSLQSDGRGTKATVHEYPVDESPYGVRGLAGNINAWCADPFQVNGPAVVDGVPQLADAATVRGPGSGGAHRMVKGGAWRDGEDICRGAFRDSPPAHFRATYLGFRIVRSYTPEGAALIGA